MNTVLVKYDNKNRCVAIYKFTYKVDPALYPGTLDVTKKFKKNKIKIHHFFMKNEKNEKINKLPLASIID